jgi:capsular exopolysaccharide synthesis family protein
VLATEFRRIGDHLNWSTDPAGKPTGPKHVLVTSAIVGEGKSTVASFLALSSAIYLNQKTLLLDCDLRRPAVHHLFGEALAVGLADCLSGKAPLDSCLRPTDTEKLKILTAGTPPPDPAETLANDRWPDLLAEAAFYFDRIVIDCAPVIPVDDAVVIGRMVDGVLMVVRAGSTQREVAERAARIMRDSRLNLLGVVLNNLDDALPYYYSQKYYGYRYYRSSH